MVSPRPKIKFTYEDYRNAPEDKRYELIDGDLLLIPSPKTYHQKISIRLVTLIWECISTRSLGEFLCAPFDVVLSNFDVLQPDILFVSNERIHIVTEDNVQGGPDLVIEILSPGTEERDRTFKRSLYARHGVREMWMVSPEAKTVEIYRLTQQGLELSETYSQNDVLTTPLIEGLHLNLSEVF